jgi:hypothetical protein
MKPTVKVRRSHSKTHPFVVDLRAYGKGRKFFKTRNEAEAESLRQRTLLERHSREAVGLSQREMSEVIHARKTLAEYGKTITDAAEFLKDHLERVLRCKVTASELAREVAEAKRRDGCSEKYLVNSCRDHLEQHRHADSTNHDPLRHGRNSHGWLPLRRVQSVVTLIPETELGHEDRAADSKCPTFC